MSTPNTFYKLDIKAKMPCRLVQFIVKEGDKYVLRLTQDDIDHINTVFDDAMSITVTPMNTEQEDDVKPVV
jgi:hypothetical protein